MSYTYTATAPPTAAEVRTGLELAAGPKITATADFDAMSPEQTVAFATMVAAAVVAASEFPPMRKDARDLTGQRFGSLYVFARAPNLDRKTSKIQWHARCDCGKEIILRTDRFFTKRTATAAPATHCGCQRAPYPKRGPKLGKTPKEQRPPAPPKEPKPPVPAGPRQPPTAAELEEAKLRTASQMRAIGERWSTVAEYLGTTIDHAKHILSPEEDPPT